MSQSLTCTARMPLSLRSGLAAIAVFGFLSGLALATTGWVASYKLNAFSETFSETEQLALDFQVFVYLLLAIFSAVGTIFQCRTAIQVFVSMLFVELLFGLGSGIFALYLLFQKQAPETVQNCLGGSNDTFKRHLCERSPVLKGVFVALFLVICFTEILGLIVGNAYSSRLREAKTEARMENPDDDAYWKV
ncbi:hypothetical protein DFH07DRAFT_313708 [Mycena maculata]|uniref:Uncharacterized protein n=1 Tax=Mycena maculata TaxID=230809 RepID=A0AAD7JQE9_9AGAR|nr:hypothetical protein DFH07DRAFT_313708 [Mycena maculata]